MVRKQSLLHSTLILIQFLFFKGMIVVKPTSTNEQNSCESAAPAQEIKSYYVAQLDQHKPNAHSSSQRSEIILVPYYKVFELKLIPDSLIETYLFLLTQPFIKKWSVQLIRAKPLTSNPFYLRIEALVSTCLLNPNSLIAEHSSAKEQLKATLQTMELAYFKFASLGSIIQWQELRYDEQSDRFPPRKANLQSFTHLLFHEADLRALRPHKINIQTRNQLRKKDNLFTEMQVECTTLWNMVLLRKTPQTKDQPSFLSQLQSFHLQNLVNSTFCKEDPAIMTPSSYALLTVTNADEMIEKCRQERSGIINSRKDTLKRFYNQFFQSIQDASLWIRLSQRITSQLCIKFTSLTQLLQVFHHLQRHNNALRGFHLEPITLKDYEKKITTLNAQLPMDDLQLLLNITMGAEHSLDINYPNFRWNLLEEVISMPKGKFIVQFERKTDNTDKAEIAQSVQNSRKEPQFNFFRNSKLFASKKQYHKVQQQHEQNFLKQQKEDNNFETVGKWYHKYRGVVAEMSIIWSQPFRAFLNSLAANYLECDYEDQVNVQKFVYYCNYLKLMYPKVYDRILSEIDLYSDNLCMKLQMPTFTSIINEINKDQKESDIKKLLDFYSSQGCIINNPTEKLISLFYKTAYEKDFNNKQLKIKIKDKGIKRPIRQYFEEYTEFSIFTSGIQDILSKLKFFCFERLCIDNPRSLWSDQLLKYTNFVSHIENKRLPDQGLPGCPGCMRFYYQGLNIRDDSINSVPVLALSLKLKEQHAKEVIKEYICMLLNSHGGVILFDTLAEFLAVYSQGRIITEEQKMKQKDKIKQIVEDIYPVPQMDSQVIVQFVPIAKSYHTPVSTQQSSRPSQQQTQPGKTKQSLPSASQDDFIQGKYTCRIKVKPTDPSTIYLVSQMHTHFLLLFNYQRRQIPLEDKDKYLKERIQMLSKSQKKGAQRRLLRWRSAFTSHECIEPEKGQPQSNKENYPRDLGLEMPYRDMSLVICKKKYIDYLQKKFISLGVQCSIMQPFSSHKFNLCDSTAAIYHDCPFKQLTQLASKSEFAIQKKPLLIVNVSEYIRLENRTQRPGDQQMRRISEWISKEFPGSIIRLWQYRYQENKCSYYLSGENKTTNLFLYYLLNHFGQKAFFKNPPMLDQLTLQQRSIVWSEISFQGQIHPKASERLLIKQIVALRPYPIQNDLFNQLCSALRSFVQSKYILVEEPEKVKRCFQLLSSKEIQQLTIELANNRRLTKEKAKEVVRRITQPVFIQEYLSRQ